jgi:hypothetical protein
MNKVYIVYFGSEFDSPILYSVHASEQGAKNAIEKYIDQKMAKESHGFLTPEKCRELYEERFYWDEVDLLD